MENPDEYQPPMGLPTTAEGSGGGTGVPPPAGSSAQGATAVETGTSGVEMPSSTTDVTGRGEEREREEEGSDDDRPKEAGGDGGGDPVVASSGGGEREGSVVGGSGGGDVCGSGGSGLGGGDDAAVSERAEERDKEVVEIASASETSSSGSEETVDERGTGVGSSGDRVVGTSGVTRTRAPRWRIEPRPSQQPSGGDRGKAVVIGDESATQGTSGGPSAQGPVGISREDYLEHAPQEVVMAAAADAPGNLDVAREAIVEGREREAALLREAADEDAAARAFWEEFETEEAAEEARLRAEEEERAAGHRTTVVQAARQRLRRGRPALTRRLMLHQCTSLCRLVQRTTLPAGSCTLERRCYWTPRSTSRLTA